MTASGTRYTLATVRKAVDVLETLAEHEHGLSLGDLVEATGLDRATAYRYLVTLEQLGLLRRDRDSGLFTLGMGLFRLGMRAVSNLDIRRIAFPRLRSLVERHAETVNLAVLRENEMVLIEVLESPQSIKKGARLGDTDKLHSSALGKSVLAAVPSGELPDLLAQIELPAYTANTITEPTVLLRELDRTRRRGYAIDDEECEVGLRCVACAVRDHQGRPAYAVSVSGPTHRLTLRRLAVIGAEVARVTAEVSAALGYGGREDGAAPQG